MEKIFIKKTYFKILFSVLMIMVMLLLSVGQSFSQVPTSEYTPDTNTVGLWHFNDVTNGITPDASSTGNDGTVSGATLTSNGKFGNALDFDGVDDAVTIDNPFTGIQNQFTIEAWINVESFPPGQSIMIFRNRAHNNDIIMYMPPAPHTIHLDIFESIGVNHQYKGQTVLQPDIWYHVAVTYDNSHIRIWIDGNLELETPATFDVDWSKNYIGTSIGGNPFDVFHGFNGFIDEVRISNIARDFGTLKVSCDVKPGSDPNAINPKSKGIIPVAILTTPEFDATTVDPLSVVFGPGQAKKAHQKGHLEDADDDEDIDMVLHFKTKKSGIQQGDTEVTLSGKTLDGKEFICMDEIVTVGRKA